MVEGGKSEEEKEDRQWTYASRLGLSVDQDDRCFLGDAIDREQLFDVHLVAEDVAAGAVVDVAASDVEVRPDVGHLGIDATIRLRLSGRDAEARGKGGGLAQQSGGRGGELEELHG